MANLASPLSRALDAPAGNASLIFFRVAFGLLVSWEIGLLLFSGAANAMFRQPAMHFTYLGFGWVQPLPGLGLELHFFVTLLAALGITCGCFYRTSCLVFCIGWTWFWLMDKSYYQNHTYLISMIAFWLAFMPANGRLSIDAKMRPALRTTAAPLWNIWLLRFFIGMVYFYAGLAKLHPDWLQGEPMRGHLQQFSGLPVAGGLLASDFFAVIVASWGGLLFDLLIVPALLWRPTRHFAVAAALCFHLSNSILFEIDIFPFLAMAATLMFYPPDWPEKLLARFRGKPPRVAAARSGEPPLRGRTTPLLRGALVVFLAAQLLIPFHHLLYPGDHNWTEEGQRFSWFLMQRSKSGKVAFLVNAEGGRRKFSVDPAKYLNPRQVQQLAIEPDMQLQFAHFLERELGREIPGDIAIYAYAQVELNGRKPTEFVRHDVDLTREKRHWGACDWVLPHPGPLSRS